MTKFMILTAALQAGSAATGEEDQQSSHLSLGARPETRQHRNQVVMRDISSLSSLNNNTFQLFVAASLSTVQTEHFRA